VGSLLGVPIGLSPGLVALTFAGAVVAGLGILTSSFVRRSEAPPDEAAYEDVPAARVPALVGAASR